MTTLLAPLHVTRFACLGGACEDTCCGHWTVSIDEPHYRGLAARMAGPDAPEADRARFAATFAERAEGERTAVAHATIRMRVIEDTCPMHQPDGRCHVHARFGEDALPDACAMYPKRLAAVGDRLELSAAPSCPEVARRLLLDEDGAELCEVEPALAPRAGITRVVVSARGGALDELRGATRMLLDREDLPLGARLACSAHLAESIAENLDEDAPDPDALALEVEVATDEEVIAAFAQAFRESTASGPALQVLGGWLARLRGAVRPAFRVELDRLLARAAGEAESGVADEATTSARVAALLVRSAERPVSLPAAVEQALGRYARDFHFHEAPGRVGASGCWAFALVRELAVRLAALRLLVAHRPRSPGPGGAGGDDGDESDEAAALAFLVRCVYQIARVADHDPRLRDALLEGSQALGDTPALLGLLRIGAVD